MHPSIGLKTPNVPPFIGVDWMVKLSSFQCFTLESGRTWYATSCEKRHDDVMWYAKKVTKNRSKKAGYSELRFDSSYPTAASTSLEGLYFTRILGLMPCLLPVVNRNAQNSADLWFARTQLHPLYLLSRNDVAHVTSHTRPSHFLMWNIESWKGPGDMRLEECSLQTPFTDTNTSTWIYNLLCVFYIQLSLSLLYQVCQ